MVQAHQDSHEEGTIKPIPPQKTEQICITAWYGNCLATDHKALQRVLCTAQYITGAKLPAIQDLYTRRCQRKARKIVSHPGHRQYSLLLHVMCYRSAN